MSVVHVYGTCSVGLLRLEGIIIKVETVVIIVNTKYHQRTLGQEINYVRLKLKC